MEKKECPKCPASHGDWKEGQYFDWCNNCRYEEDKRKPLSSYGSSLYFRRPLELGFWKPNPQVVMQMAQVFQAPDPRRRWEDYWIHFYANEHLPPNNKPLVWIHLHFRGQIGEVELYLKEGYPNYRIVKQWGKIPNEIKSPMRKFVRDNYSDIVTKIQKDLKDVEVEWDGKFKK